MSQKDNYITLLKDLESIIFDLNEDNIESKGESVMNLFDINFPYSTNLIISRLIYQSFIVQKKDIKIYLLFINIMKSKEESIQGNYNIIETFTHFLLQLNSQESYYFLENMIEENYISSNIVQTKNTLYFAHYFTETKINQFRNSEKTYLNFFIDIEDLKKDNWKLHKQLIKEGINPMPVIKAIRNDDIDQLQEISSRDNFDFNQIIEPSLYEMFSFVNQKNENVTLIAYAAFFGSVKCFKYLLMNGSNLNNIGKYAVAGGNIEIIHLCEQNNCSFNQVHEIALEFHRNDVFDYFYKKNTIKIKEFTQLEIECIKNDNYSLFVSLLDNIKSRFYINIINETAKIGNIFLVKYFMNDCKLQKKTLTCATESGNFELIKFILEQKGIDINAKNIYMFYLIFILIIWDFKIIFGNYLNYFIQHL